MELHEIKKIITLDTGYTTEGSRSITRVVNNLLARGWILLNIRTVDYSEPSRPNSCLFYTLGHASEAIDADAEIEKATEQAAQMREEDRRKSIGKPLR